MEQEFRFTPQADREATFDGLRKGFTYLLAFITGCILLFTTDHQFPADLEAWHIYLVFVFLFLIPFQVLVEKQKTKYSVIKLTDTSVEFIRGQAQIMTILFTDIFGVQLCSENSLLIRSRKSNNLPVLMLSNLENQAEFLKTLETYTTIYHDTTVPVLWLPVYRSFMWFFFWLGCFMHFLFWSKIAVLLSGAVLLGFLFYSIHISQSYRNEKNSFRPILISILLAMLVIFRMVLIARGL